MARGGKRPGAGRPRSRLPGEYVTTTVELLGAQREALRAAAREQGISASELVRRLIDAHVRAIP